MILVEIDVLDSMKKYIFLMKYIIIPYKGGAEHFDMNFFLSNLIHSLDKVAVLDFHLNL